MNKLKIGYFADAPVYKGVIGAIVGFDDEGFFVKTLDSYVKVIEWSGYSNLRIGDRLI